MPGLFEGFFARHRKGATLTILVLVSLLCLTVANRAVVIKPKEIGLSVAGFFQKGFTGFFNWFGDTAGSIRQLRAAREELTAARERLQEMDQVTREILELRRQNESLRDQLDFANSLPPERIAAEVIARDTDNLFSTLTINKGSRHGVKKGMPVVAWQGDLEGLVGKVVMVGPGTSEVLPLYDPQCMVSSRVDSTRDEGLVQGEGKDRGTLVMNYVKKIAKNKITYGDLVVTSGLGGLYPKGINVGRIRDITAPTYQTSLVLQVEPIIDFDRLEYLFLIGPEPDNPAPAAGQQPPPAAPVAK
ncbi:MAG TPA: rod shape-determining protein MreC [Spirochaetia bacterium]|nr:rod shape-determining protein MreC [Spirochaetia bacterium]